MRFLLKKKKKHTNTALEFVFLLWTSSFHMISKFVSFACWHSWDRKIPCLSLRECGVLNPTLSLGLSAISAKTFVTWVIISGVLMGSEPRERRRRRWERERKREAEGEGVWLVWFHLTGAYSHRLAEPRGEKSRPLPSMRDSEKGRKRTTEGLWRLSQSQSAGMSLTPPEEAVNWSAPLREREKREKKEGWRQKSAFAEDVWRPIYPCKDTGREPGLGSEYQHTNESLHAKVFMTILEGRDSALHVHPDIQKLEGTSLHVLYN